MIEANGLTKQYGSVTAIEDISFRIEPGRVTGFLGPNGAGKSTTMRLILGLHRPTRGSVTVNGRPFAKSRAPLHEVGALLDAGAVHGGRGVRDHLLCLARSNGLSRRRVDAVLEQVGLTSVTGRRCKLLSLGMKQRLGIAAALLGDPQILIFDEPVNGLDPEGIRWLRRLLKGLAAEGRTVFVSSHLMSEMQNTADHLLVIGHGRIIADMPLDQFIKQSSGLVVKVRSPRAGVLSKVLAGAGGRIDGEQDDTLTVHGMTAERIGDLAFDNDVPLHELGGVQRSLEEAFMETTAQAVQYRAGGMTPAVGGGDA
jgi:ABC-2 type transport system ATP-binding protein